MMLAILSVQQQWYCDLFTNESIQLIACTAIQGWLSSRKVSVVDSGAEGPGFKSQLVAALLRVARVTTDLA